MSPSQFVKHVRKECIKHGVKLVLEKKPRLVAETGSNGMVHEYEGYFDSLQKTPVLAVAIGRPSSEWLGVLVHEYCHMMQWLEKSPLFMNSKVDDEVEVSQLRDFWIYKKIELTQAQLHKYTMVMLKMEVDCERRAVKIIKKHNLPINLDDYCQEANLFLLMYHAMKKSRSYPNPKRFQSKEVLSHMPKNFRISYEKPPQHLVDLIYNYSFKHLKK